MNAVYKLIWNLSTGTWAVAPEFAAARGKKSRTRLAAAVAVALVLPAGAALAADSPDALQCAVNETVSADGLRCEALSPMTTKSNRASIMAGVDSYEAGVGSSAAGARSVAVGDGALVRMDYSRIPTDAVAVGYGAIVGDAGAGESPGGIAIGSGSHANGTGSIAIGYESKNAGSGSTAIGNGATSQRGVAVGNAAAGTGNESVAVGNTASSSASGAVAIGKKASATAANSVAIGAESVADRANSVSVGTTTAQRQIVNMAAGTAATDAVNLSQLTPVVTGLGGGAAIDATTGVVTGPSYNFGTHGTFTNVGGALGNLNTRVNGMDHGAVPSGVASATGTAAVALGANTRAEGNWSVAIGAATGADRGAHAVGSSAIAIGAVSEARANNSVALGANTVADRANTVSVGAVTNGTVVGFTRQIVNMAAGTQANDAVNVSQLAPVVAGLGGGAAIDATTGVVTGPSYNFGSNGSFTDVGGALGNLDTRVNSMAAGAGLVTRDGATGNIQMGAGVTGGTVSLRDANADSRVLTGVRAGVGNTDAVNVGQLKPVLAGLGGGAGIDASGVVTGPTYSVNGTTVTNVGDAITNIDGRTTTNTNDIASHTTAITNLTNGTVGMVQQAAAGANLTVGKDNDGAAVDFTNNAAASRTLVGVANGAVTATSNEAINGSQLHGTAQSVADSLGGGSVVNPDGTISAPSYSVGGTTVTNLGDAITNIDGRTTTNTTAITNLTSGTVGMVQQATAGANLTVGKDNDGAAVDFTNNAGAARTLAGVANGAVNATSNEAINGSQLHGTAQSVADGLGGGSVVNADGTLSAPSYSVGGTTVTNVGDAITNIDGRVTTNAGDIANLQDSLANGTVGLVTYDDVSGTVKVAAAKGGTTVDFAGVDANGVATARTLTNVAAGDVSATSTDAVNGSQLHGTAQSVADSLGGGSVVNPDGTISAPSYSIGGTTVTNLGDAITNIDGRTTTNTGDIADLQDSLANGTVGLVTYDDVSGTVKVAAAKGGTTVDFAGVDANGVATARTLTNVAAGGVSATSTDAINGSQLHGTAQSVADGLGGGSVVNADGTLSAPSYSVGGTTVTNVGDAITNIDGRTTTNAGDIADLQDNLANGTVGLVTYDDVSGTVKVAAAKGGTTVDFAGVDANGVATARMLTNVAAGGVSATSTDAVNGSQLHGTAQSVADGLGGGSVVNPDGTISAPSYSVGGTTVTNIGDAITNIDGRTTTNTGDITNLTSVVNNLSAGSAGLVTMDPTTGNVNVAAAQGGTVVNMGGTAGDRRLAGVANGVADDEAATIAQLKASGLVDPNDGRALGAVVYDDISLGRATLGGTGGTVLGNVGNGLIASGSMEAINGGQLFQMNADWESKWSALDGRVGTIENGLANGSIGGPGQGAGPGTGTGEGMIGAGDGAGSIVIGDGTPGSAGAAGGDGAIAIGSGSSAAGNDSVAIGSGSIADRDREVSVGAPGAERVIGNVAAGTRPTDAVNLQQMDDRFAAERDWSNGRFQAVDKRIDRMGAISAAYAGMAINTAGLSGDNRVGAGIGSQNGRSALAVGYQRILGEKKNVSVSLGGAFSGSDQSVSAGAGFSW